MYYVEAPGVPLDSLKDKFSVFLAGSIEQGTAEDWQAKAVQFFKNDDFVVYNPRRSDWNPNATREEVVSQIKWELTNLHRSSIILFYFDPDTLAPITIWEMGAFKDQEIVVVCPDGYWRKTNVDTVCEWYGTRQLPTLEAALAYIQQYGRASINCGACRS